MTNDGASTVRSKGPGTHELRYPGDIYSALGSIVVLVERLPATLALLDQTFTGLVEAGHIKGRGWRVHRRLPRCCPPTSATL